MGKPVGSRSSRQSDRHQWVGKILRKWPLRRARSFANLFFPPIPRMSLKRVTPGVRYQRDLPIPGDLPHRSTTSGPGIPMDCRRLSALESGVQRLPALVSIPRRESWPESTTTPVPRSLLSMSLANAKKLNSVNTQASMAAVARLRRRGGASRLGRRSALMGVLSSMYANTTTARPVGSGATRTLDPRNRATEVV